MSRRITSIKITQKKKSWRVGIGWEEQANGVWNEGSKRFFEAPSPAFWKAFEAVAPLLLAARGTQVPEGTEIHTAQVMLDYADGTAMGGKVACVFSDIPRPCMWVQSLTLAENLDDELVEAVDALTPLAEHYLDGGERAQGELDLDGKEPGDG